jgi:hypothetical protein
MLLRVSGPLSSDVFVDRKKQSPRAIVAFAHVQRHDNGVGLSRSPFAAPNPATAFAYVGCFNAVVSTGSFRRRLPVAAKIALVTAGTMAEVPGSPIPPGGSELWTI